MIIINIDENGTADICARWQSITPTAGQIEEFEGAFGVSGWTDYAFVTLNVPHDEVHAYFEGLLGNGAPDRKSDLLQLLALVKRLRQRR